MKNTIELDGEPSMEITVVGPKHLGYHSFPNTHFVPDGYDMKSVPSMTEENFHILIDEHNKLVDFVTSLMEKIYIK